MKLGRAVEISPKVLMVQLTSWERMSHAASADSVQLSTWFGGNMYLKYAKRQKKKKIEKLRNGKMEVQQ